MSSDEQDKSWKVKLRYGKIATPYHHYTVLAEGIVGELAEPFVCRPGPAWMGMKTWAESAEESGDMITAIGREIGFTVTGEILVYDTEPNEAPRERPYGYDIGFTPFEAAGE